ncbi:MAG: isoprenylcysteine carboxylmethyltransferase family protein [Gemmatimonadaceae bacterium]|nr:isoprenylcysteine carboxylmethyltransferase family protein [Gemmatimonadaceae bacterium]
MTSDAFAERGPVPPFPPPLLYALPLLGGYVLHRWRPFPFLPGAVSLVAGVILVALGLVGIPALRAMRRSGTSPLPWHPVSALVTDGPYRLTRNPMYVGMTLLYLGGSALMNSAWPLAFLPVILFVMNALVIPREERHLAERFGEPYLDYCRRVRRWI